MINSSLEHKLFVLDGDRYRTEEERIEQLEKFYTGSESDKEQKRREVLKHISSFDLPDGFNPEKYINQILRNPINGQNEEIVNLAREIIAPNDNHKYLDDIIDGLGVSEEVGLYMIIEDLSKHPEWRVYTNSVRRWLNNEKTVLSL